RPGRRGVSPSSLENRSRRRREIALPHPRRWVACFRGPAWISPFSRHFGAAKAWHSHELNGLYVHSLLMAQSGEGFGGRCSEWCSQEGGTRPVSHFRQIS